MTAPVSKLKNIGLFQKLKEHELEQISAIAHTINFNRDDVIIRDNDTDDAVYLIIAGRVDVLVTVPGTDKTEMIATIKQGEVFGELILLGQVRRSARVIAKENVSCLSWKKEDMIKLFESSHHIGYRVMTNIAALLANRLHSTNMVLRTVLTVPYSMIL